MANSSQIKIEPSTFFRHPPYRFCGFVEKYWKLYSTLSSCALFIPAGSNVYVQPANGTWIILSSSVADDVFALRSWLLLSLILSCFIQISLLWSRPKSDYRLCSLANLACFLAFFETCERGQYNGRRPPAGLAGCGPSRAFWGAW